MRLTGLKESAFIIAAVLLLLLSKRKGFKQKALPSSEGLRKGSMIFNNHNTAGIMPGNPDKAAYNPNAGAGRVPILSTNKERDIS